MKFTHICRRILVPLASLIWIASAHSGEVENVRLKNAVAEGNAREVQAALEAGANPRSTYEGDYSVSVLGRAVALHSLVEAGDDESEKSASENIVKLLVQAGALKGSKGSNKHEGILFWPVAKGNIPLLRFLIANGANVSEKNEELTLAEIAVQYSQDEAYQILIKEGAVPVSPDSIPLLRFVKVAGIQDIVAMQIQLDAGAKINGTTRVRFKLM